MAAKNKLGIKNKRTKRKLIRWYGKPCQGCDKPCGGIEPLDDPSFRLEYLLAKRFADLHF